ncbi:predicted protein [Histoplasma mississippiense (nom. inval.)]|uniref:predicted protein n=1 Tax=Ajellomyces capsulatus (strain NAm1 / WU24) TaxID=2059318 RepID=UPI000157C3FE|nr:predicted protein [Histoplasma mississippiense (nom. inval.)]EDN07956.1 predicted protein [Histoplasma mississippiense (nom. inval.)]
MKCRLLPQLEKSTRYNTTKYLGPCTRSVPKFRIRYIKDDPNSLRTLGLEQIGSVGRTLQKNTNMPPFNDAA